MKVRLLGAALCFFITSASAITSYVPFLPLGCAIAVNLPPSFFSLDGFDDFADAGYPDGLVNRTVREKPSKMPLGFRVRTVRLPGGALEPPHAVTQPLSSHQELYRYQAVLRF
jgi:hypothetical protein